MNTEAIKYRIYLLDVLITLAERTLGEEYDWLEQTFKHIQEKAKNGSKH